MNLEPLPDVCPACGALPCDWVNAPDDLIAEMARQREVIEAWHDIDRKRDAETERLRGALGHAIAIIEKHVEKDALGMGGDPETGMWPLLDEYLHHMRAAIKEPNHDE